MSSLTRPVDRPVTKTYTAPDAEVAAERDASFPHSPPSGMMDGWVKHLRGIRPAYRPAVTFGSIDSSIGCGSL